VPYPIVLVLGGLVLGFVPGLPLPSCRPSWSWCCSCPIAVPGGVLLLPARAAGQRPPDRRALVAYRLAVAAVVAGSFSLWQAGLRFVAGAVGGVAIGLAVGWLITEACAGSRTRWSRSCCRW